MRKNIDWQTIFVFLAVAAVLINGFAMTAKYGWISTWNFSKMEIWQMWYDLWFG